MSKRQAAETKTRAAQHGVERPSLPHERDESHESQEREVGKDPVERSAASDVRKHQVDTDRGPAVDKAYRRLKSGA